MRFTIFSLLVSLLCISVTLTGQTGLVSGNLNVTVFPTNLGGGKFQVAGVFSDPKGQWFTADVDTGMVFWKGNNMYIIDSVITASGSNLTIRVRDIYSTGFIPTGTCYIVERTPKGIPGVSVTGDSNPSFATPPDYAAGVNNSLVKIDSLLDTISTMPLAGDLDGNLPNPLVVGLNGIPLSPLSPDTLQVLQYTGNVWTPVTFLSGIMVASDSFYVDDGNTIALVAAGDTIFIPAIPPDLNGIYSGSGTVNPGTETFLTGFGDNGIQFLTGRTIPGSSTEFIGLYSDSTTYSGVALADYDGETNLMPVLWNHDPSTNDFSILAIKTGSLDFNRRVAGVTEGRFVYSGDRLVINSANGVPGIQLEKDAQGTVSILHPGATTTWDLTLPANNGDPGQVLTTDGSGVTSWGSGGVGGNIYTTDGSIPSATNRVVTIPSNSSLLFSNSPYSMGFASTWGPFSLATGWGAGYSSGGVKSQFFQGTQSGSPVSGAFIETGSIRNGLSNSLNNTSLKSQNPGTLDGGGITAAIGGATLGYLDNDVYLSGILATNGGLSAFNTNTLLTVNYPIDRPVSNSFWRYNSDGTGQYIAAASIGATDLSFSGSGPVTLNSSTGTDVTYTAGSNVSFSGVSGTNITINATDNNGIYSGDGTVANGTLATLSGQLEFVNGTNSLLLNPAAGIFSIGNAGGSTSMLLDVSGNYTDLRGTASTAMGLRFREGVTNGTNYVALKAPNLISSNVTLTLPGDTGTSGQALITDGAGVTSWGAVSSTWLKPSLEAGNVTINSLSNLLTFNAQNASPGSYTTLRVLTQDGTAAKTDNVFQSVQTGGNYFGIALNSDTYAFNTSEDISINTRIGSGGTAKTLFMGNESTGSANEAFHFSQVGKGAELRLKAGGNYVGIKPADSGVTSYVITLPTNDGSAGQVLSNTDGAGTLGWANAGSQVIAGLFSGTTDANGVISVTLSGTPSVGACTCTNNATTPASYRYIFSATYTGGTGVTVRVFDADGFAMLNAGAVNFSLICL